MFYFDKIDGRKILKTNALQGFKDKINLIFTTRETCIKTKEEQEAEAVKANREVVLDHLNIDRGKLFTLEQRHTSNIEILSSKNNERHLKNTDGAVLSESGTAVILNFADCTPVLLYDPENNVAAGLHAGWRGTAEKIAVKGVEIMAKKFNSNPKNIIAVIGPCIDIQAFETGEDVCEKLLKTVNNKEGLMKPENGKPHLDLAKINAYMLNEAGVETIDISPFKTTLNNEDFYSYRLNNQTTNRISMVIKLC